MTDPDSDTVQCRLALILEQYSALTDSTDPAIRNQSAVPR